MSDKSITVSIAWPNDATATDKKVVGTIVSDYGTMYEIEDGGSVGNFYVPINYCTILKE